MKKVPAIVLLSVMMLALFAAPAFAAPLRVSSTAVSLASVAPVHIDFAGTVNEASAVRVVIYRGATAVRAITARVSGTLYTASWDLKDANGLAVPSGAYAYRVTAVATSGRAFALGRVRVPVPAPAPKPAPVPAPVPSRWVGFYPQGNLSSMDTLLALESQVGTRAAVVNLYVTDTDGFPVNRAKSIADHGSIPMVTLEFWSVQSGGVAAIDDGSKDAALIRFADAAKAHGGEIWLRPFHEMNSNWYPWAGATNGNSAAKVVAAWKHVRELFASRGATNVKFVWCVNNESVPNTTANAIGAYWPGDAYVDKLSIDGYNFGTSDPSWSTWRTFGSVIGSSYTTVTKLSAKPLFLAEAGCVEQGGNKATWIADMFKVIKTSYPRITGICWFNVNDLASTNTDWRVDSSATSLSAFKTGVAGGY